MKYFIIFQLASVAEIAAENEYFGGMKNLWIYFGSSQNWTIFRGHFYAF